MYSGIVIRTYKFGGSIMDNFQFVKEIAPYIIKQCVLRGYMYPSAIIAQACLESGYGESGLASKYHNYFGIKCGAAWRGKSVNLATKEEYTAGTLTAITDNFRVYDDMQTGVAGYFEFLAANSRYANLLSATSAHDYLERIKADGYATSAKYVSNIEGVRTIMGLDRYDYGGELITSLDTISAYFQKGFFDNGDTRKENLYSLAQAWTNKKLAG